jgi:drug/metabolite transporter (DMT)-like permease
VFHEIQINDQRVLRMQIKNPRNKGILLMVICAVLWSTGGIFIKLIPWNPMFIAGFRSLIAAAVYAFYMRWQRIPFVVNRDSVLAGIFISGNFFLYIAANKLTTAANAIVIQYSAPIYILIISALLYRQRFRRGDLLTVALTTLGIALFFFDKLSNKSMLGNLLAVFAGVFFAAMFVVTGHADDRSRASGIMLAHLIATVVGLPFFFFSQNVFSMPALAAIFALGIFQLGIPYLLYGIAAKNSTPLSCSLISFIEPLLNPVWVFLFNGEAPGFYALLGGAVVLATVVVYTVWNSKAPAAASRQPS